MGGLLSTGLAVSSLLHGSATQTTYSFKDLVGSLTNAGLGTSFPITGGNVGNGSISIRMLTVRTEHEVAADGTVMPSYIAGQNAEVTIEVQQTSAMHHALIDLFDLLELASNSGDVSAWASTVLAFRTLLDGSTHILSGVSFQKIPDKTYAARGGMITWTLLACHAVTS